VRAISTARVRYLGCKRGAIQVRSTLSSLNQISYQMEPKYKSLQKSDFSIALPYMAGAMAVFLGLVFAQRYFLPEPLLSEAAVAFSTTCLFMVHAVAKARTFPNLGKGEADQ
jgi:hypothetical protein